MAKRQQLIKSILILHNGEGQGLTVSFEGDWKAKEIMFVQHQVSKAFRRHQLSLRRTLEEQKLTEQKKEEANE